MATPSSRARCATMRLATDPTKVKLPASVEAIATTSHARCGSSEFAMNGFNTRTAGTLLTRLDSPAVTAESPKTLLRSRPPIAAATSEERTAASNPVTTIKRPTNIRSSGQSISR
jgi:hypothetical protein